MSPLTQQQRDLVAQNLGLVRVQVRRQLLRLPPDIRRREREDLLQVGTLGLMLAATRYRPSSHGPFAAYALAYIHGALCRYLVRQMNGLGAPFKQAAKIVRRQRLARARADWELNGLPVDGADAAGPADEGRCPPPVLPQFFDLQTSDGSLAKVACQRARQAARAEAVDRPAGGREGWSAQERHERYVEALEWAAGKVKATPSAHVDHAALVQAVVQERLRVPEIEFRTARRALAARFGCSPTRVWNIEVRLLRLVRRRLESEVGASHEAATVVCRPTCLVAGRQELRRRPRRKSSLPT
jgi:hypothetical protein